jgi:hypothetical protein
LESELEPALSMSKRFAWQRASRGSAEKMINQTAINPISPRSGKRAFVLFAIADTMAK